MPEWMTETVIVQIVITAGVILGAGIPAYFAFRSKLAEIGKDAREAREQVKNDHDTNLREEGDERHGEQMKALKELARDVRGLREDHYETRKDIGMLHAEDRAGRRETQALRQEFADHIEQTAPLMPTLEALQRNLHKD